MGRARVRDASAQAVAVAALVAAGCASFPQPYTAAELRADSGDRAGEALVHYLSQPNADAAVCDPQAGVLRRFDGDDFEELLDGLDGQDVPARLWASCAQRLLVGLSADSSRAANVGMAELFIDRIDATDGDRAQLAVLQALLVVLETRPASTPMPAAIESSLREAIAEDVRGSRARTLAESLLESLEIERGHWRGRPVTPEVLASVEDLAVLRRFLQRLPAPAARAAARARIIDLHIARSPSPWVRAHADEVRERVNRTGRNALDPRAHPPRSARYQASPPGGTVLVEQNVATQSARLLFQRPSDTTVVPSLDLRGALLLALDGMSEAVTLCGPASALDVTPCLDSGELVAKSPVVRIDADGALHFEDGLDRDRLLGLLRQGHRLTIPLELGGAPLLQIEWPMRVTAPEPIVFGRGQHLNVRVEEAGGRLLVWHAEVGAPLHVVVLEPDQLGRFAIVTRGLQGSAGAAGHRGSDGMRGMAGRHASCPSMGGGSGGMGHPGGRGGNGGPGGPGQPGGDIHLTVVCARPDCEPLVAVARSLVRSEGGAGGRGGAGGQGGRGGEGGQGGSGTSCRDAVTGHSRYLPSGSSGSRGMDGARGTDGPRGRPGQPGRLFVQVVTP